MELEVTLTDALILWINVNFQALRRRRAMQRLTRRRRLRFRRYKISSAIYSAQACWIEFLIFHKALRGSVPSHHLGTRVLSACI